MPVTQVQTDLDLRQLKLEAEFDAAKEAVWELWTDPRKLEKWWGPPGYPATFTEHNLTPGGRVAYYMTGPDGSKYGGVWDVTSVNPPNSLTFSDAFADEHGVKTDSMPKMESTMTLEDIDGKTVMTLISTYSSVEDLQPVIDMGMEEGITLAVNQMDDLLV